MKNALWIIPFVLQAYNLSVAKMKYVFYTLDFNFNFILPFYLTDLVQDPGFTHA